MLIRTLMERDGILLTMVASTNGGEYAGACPFCGGKDRFRVWPKTGRYWCRQCKASGDGIQYLRDKHGMEYHEACEVLSIDSQVSCYPATNKELDTFVHDEDGWLNLEWQKSAWSFLHNSRMVLQSANCSQEREYLRRRGLNEKTITGVGWNPTTIWLLREGWGLLPELNEDTRKPKKIWLPEGLVVPVFDKDLIHRLRIRLSQRAFEASKEWTNGKGVKYIEVTGSGHDPLCLFGQDGSTTWAVVESELDALLIRQEAGDLVNVMGLGSVNVRLPFGMVSKLSRGSVLVCLDYDEAGIKEASGYWSHIGEYWPVPCGKDPGDFYQAGGDIRAWIELGLSSQRGSFKIEMREMEGRNSPPHTLLENSSSHDPERGQEQKTERGSVGFFSLPCQRDTIRCFHLQDGQCFYKGNWGPVIDLEGLCPMIFGDLPGEAHPDLEQLYRQREAALKP